jgi:hypothetical protein
VLQGQRVPDFVVGNSRAQGHFLNPPAEQLLDLESGLQQARDVLLNPSVQAEDLPHLDDCIGRGEDLNQGIRTMVTPRT